jgi:hypothetical protein
VYHNVTRKKPATDPPDDEPGGRDEAETEAKDRVIHTRVPESLEAELRKRAQDLGISVSNLVRNVIGHAFGLVGDVAADSHAIARAARGETEGPDGRSSKPPARASRAPAPVAEHEEVIAWQPIVLAKNAICSRCNDILPRGKEAAIAIGGNREILCLRCLDELRK